MIALCSSSDDHLSMYQVSQCAQKRDGDLKTQLNDTKSGTTRCFYCLYLDPMQERSKVCPREVIVRSQQEKIKGPSEGL